MLQSSNKFTATANVLTEFLPVVDTLNRLRVQYGTNEFGKQYNALPGAVVSGFVNLGCTDFIATIGENALDGMRYTVTASEYSDEWAKDYIVRVGTPGLELSGNVIRKAEVVASLGKQDTESTTESSDVAPLDKPENDVNKFA